MTVRTPTEDQCLVEAAQKDPQAFGAIFDTYYPVILRYVARRTADVELAEDITAEVFIKALRGMAHFTWQGVPLTAWLYKIATNELRMYYRKKRYSSSLDELQELHDFEPIDEKDFVAELTQAQEQLERHQTFLKVQRCIAQLPIKYQEVLVLRFAEDKKIHEISQILNKKEGTVKSLISRGLQMVRKQLDSAKTQHSQPTYIIDSEGREQ